MDKKDWLMWRLKGVGASDVGTILGISPYSTPYQLYTEKISRKVSDKTNFIMEKGNQMEPIARVMFELLHEKDFPPLMVIHPNKPYMRCTLDGINVESRKLIEIKYTGNNFLEVIHPWYIAQIQYQMICTGIRDASLVEINNNEEIKETPIIFDAEFANIIEEKVTKFWAGVIARIPPKLTIKDSIKLQDKDKIKAIKKMRSIKSKMDKLTEEYKSLEENVLKGLAKHGHNTGLASITCVKRIGSISYKKIPELAGVDLEQYRGADSKYFKFNFKKAGKK